jgi:hypothetical protein
MKNIIKYLCFTISVGILMTSCEDTSEPGGESVINFTSQTVTVTASQSSFTFDESLIDTDVDATFSTTLTATIPTAQQVNAVVTFWQSAGNATSDDYSVGSITIPAGATSASTTLEVMQNGTIEGTETFTLKANTDGGNFNVASFELPVTISNDFVNGVMEFSTTWAGEYTFEATASAMVTVDFCEMDLDVLLFTSAGAFVQYLGATGSCTETGELTGLPDGDYWLVLDMYDNPLSVFGATEPVPVTISYNQDYFQSGDFVVGGYDLGSPTGLSIVGDVNISGGYNYTVAGR